MTDPDVEQMSVGADDLQGGDSPLMRRSSLHQVLTAVVSGRPGDGASALRASETTEPDVVESLVQVLESDLTGAQMAERLGDVLRSALHVSNQLANECYRASFYLSRHWEALAGNPLYARFAANKAGQPLDKWVHYFEVYDQVLRGYVGQPIRLLEIGVFHGGGLDQLRSYLGPRAHVVGIDIDPAVKAICADRFPVEIGDQTDTEFLDAVVDRHGPFDVIIDDGGHTMAQQITAVESLFAGLEPGGTYLVEDCHTSYWPQYQDAERTFIDWAKDRVDDLNAYHHSRQVQLPIWATSVSSAQFFDSIVVLQKGRRYPPFCEVAGTGSFISGDRFDESMLLWKQAMLRSTEEQLSENQRAFADLHAEMAALRTELASIKESRSYRATAPVRRFGGSPHDS